MKILDYKRPLSHLFFLALFFSLQIFGQEWVIYLCTGIYMYPQWILDNIWFFFMTAKIKNKFVPPGPCCVKKNWLFSRIFFFFLRNLQEKIVLHRHWSWNSRKSLDVFIGETIHIEKSYCNGRQNCLFILSKISLFWQRKV